MRILVLEDERQLARHITQALSLKPADARYRFRCGVVKEKLGRKDEAVADFQKARALGLSPALQKQTEKHLQNLQAN